jgi:peptidyl-prolyl cis-trans isomerase B (cyclophilin B)
MKRGVWVQSVVVSTVAVLACAQGVPPMPPSADETKDKPSAEPAKSVVVAIETSMGSIKAELWPDKASETVKNFLQYADDKFYDGLIFHRVIDGFMIQGGGFTADMQQKETRGPIKNEACSDVVNARGTLAMARTAVVDSATAQFFINLVDNAFLNHKDKTPRGYGYCVFGKVIEGMAVVDKIAKVKTEGRGPHQNVPSEPVVIKSIRRAAPAPPTNPAAPAAK